MATRKTTTLAALALVAIPTVASAGPEPRLAPPGCITVAVEPGGNVWSIAQRTGTTLDVIAALNPQIRNLSLVHPGDQIAVNCPGLDNVKANPTLPAPIVVNEVQRTVVSKQEVLEALAAAGARGDQLVTLASVTESESGRRLDAVGDVELQSGDWGPSRGVFQIRTLKSQTGTGKTRDIVRVATLEGGARSAVELCQQSIARGADCGTPWTVYLKGWHKPFMAEYAELAKGMGL